VVFNQYYIKISKKTTLKKTQDNNRRETAIINPNPNSILTDGVAQCPAFAFNRNQFLSRAAGEVIWKINWNFI
jgi:hypothetical protein